MSNTRHQSTAPTETRLLAHGDDTDLHWHDDHQLIYASRGVLEVHTEAGIWFTPASRCVFIPATVRHRWQTHGLSTVHMLGISADSFQGAPHPFLCEVTPLVRELIKEISAQNPTSLTTQRLKAVLLDYLQPVDLAQLALPTVHDERLQQVEAYLLEHLQENLALARLGRQLGLGERTLSRLCAEQLNMGFHHWRQHLRLHRAILLLAEGASVSRAASDSGFSSPSAFISVFKTVFGVTPGSLYR